MRRVKQKEFLSGSPSIPRLKLEFHGSRVTFNAGLLAFRELDDALGLTNLAGEVLADTRTGQNSRHTLTAQISQSFFGRLTGYEDANEPRYSLLVQFRNRH